MQKRADGTELQAFALEPSTIGARVERAELFLGCHPVRAIATLEYLGRAAAKRRFDLIVADRPDPVGPGKALFGDTFYSRVRGALRPGGFATFQTGVPFYQPCEITDALKELKGYFPQSGLYLTVVPTYVGGYMALSWAGDRRLGTPAGIKSAQRRFAKARLRTDYYNPEVHAAAFAFPEWVKRLVPKAKTKR